MELTIDGQRCLLGEERWEIPGYDLGKTADPNECRGGRILKGTIPATAENDRILRSPQDPRAAPRFNDLPHEAVVSEENVVLFAGKVRLLAVSDEEYTLEIRESGVGWAENAARRMIDKLGVEYEGLLTPTEISAGWRGDSPVKFFPIRRDEYPPRNNPTDLMPAERILSTDDYHPFLHIATLVRRIFREAGYTLRSRFLDSPFFGSLYMSGEYASRNTESALRRMGFSARRRGDSSAVANEVGKVNADPTTPLNSVGNIVDTASPQSTDDDGMTIDGLFNNGGCFDTNKNGRIRFTPLAGTTVGFEFFLRYTSEHRIRSRTRLEGFDTVYLGPGSEVAFALANRYEDRRGDIAPGYAYRAIVFDHREGAQYRLTCTRNGSPGTVWGSFATRSAVVTAPSGRIGEERLEVRSAQGWKPYDGDWALYAGYIGETGQTTVELRVRTASEQVSPEKPRYFDQIYFSGARPGMKITVHKECSLRPVFFPGPGFGSRIRFADVARLGIRQIELLEALAHLFNLRFFTEEGRKVVWVEPAAEFFGSGPEVDWSDRTVRSDPVERKDRTLEVHTRRTWCYQEGDGAVRRFETETGTTLGAWHSDNPSPAAIFGNKTLRNNIFTPSVCAAGYYLNAPSAQILQVGDRDDPEPSSRISPRIVRYVGMHPLPDGERWGYPSGEAAYPLAAFLFAGDRNEPPFTLGFEERHGAEGLHRFYDRQIGQETSGERITLTLRIAPDEFAGLSAPGSGAPEVRSVFRIDTGYEVVRATIHAIGKYDPRTGTARCSFDRIPEE